MMAVTLVIVIIVTSAVTSSEKFMDEERGCLEIYVFSPVLLPVVIGVVVVHIDLIMIVRDHWLLAEKFKKEIINCC